MFPDFAHWGEVVVYHKIGVVDCGYCCYCDDESYYSDGLKRQEHSSCFVHGIVNVLRWKSEPRQLRELRRKQFGKFDEKKNFRC